MDNDSQNENSSVIPLLKLRKAIGIMGIAFPFVVSLGGLLLFRTGIQDSISDYYHTGMRDVFVGMLFGIGFFLLSYRGYETADNIAANLGCAFAVGLSLFPTAPEGDVSSTVGLIGHIHLAFGALFFLTLIYFSLFLFTKTSKQLQPTKRKLQRNRVYRICGFAMGACILLITAYYLLPGERTTFLGISHPVFVFEAIMVVAFGISWITKAEAILKDDDGALNKK